MSSPPIQIRLYHGGDRDAVHRIAADTAFFGEPLEYFLEDRRLFIDLFYRYYTDYEGNLCWVACAGDDVVGFLTGCADTRRQRSVTVRRLVPQAIRRWLSGGYNTGVKTWVHYSLLAWSALRGQVPRIDISNYPAHLHINVQKGWRGRGIGQALMEAYFRQLNELGAPGVHLYTTDRNRAACRLYERMGMRLMDARKTRLWETVLGEPVENRVYALQLD